MTVMPTTLWTDVSRWNVVIRRATVDLCAVSGGDNSTLDRVARSLPPDHSVGHTTCMKSLAIAAARSAALLGLALSGAVVAGLTPLAFVPGFGLGAVFLIPPVTVAGRRYTMAVRRLCGRWCGVDIAAPYQPEPPQPVRRPDGLFEQDNSLHKYAWWPR